MTGVGEETIVLKDEFERLDDRLDELADQAADAEDPSGFRSIASNLETQLSGVVYLREEFGAETAITVRGLTAGEYAKVEDTVARYRQEADGNPTPGARKNVFAAAGLVDGPFGGLDDAEDLEDYVAIVADQPVGVRDWLYGHVNDLTTVSAEGFRSFSERLADSQA